MCQSRYKLQKCRIMNLLFVVVFIFLLESAIGLDSYMIFCLISLRGHFWIRVFEDHQAMEKQNRQPYFPSHHFEG